MRDFATEISKKFPGHWPRTPCWGGSTTPLPRLHPRRCYAPREWVCV